MRWFIALALVIGIAGVTPASATCSVPQTTPGFTAGGNVFGKVASQWNAYFRSKIDAMNGTLCGGNVIDSTLTAPVITGGTISGTVIGGATITGTTLNAPVITGGTITDSTITYSGASQIVRGSGVSTIGEPAIWDNIAGTLLKNGLGVQVEHSDVQTAPITGSGSAWTTYSNIADGIVAPQIWAWVNRPPGSDISDGPYDTQRCVLTPPIGTNKIVGCFGAYVISPAPAAVGSIGYIGEFIADADGASVWGLNFLFGDNRGWEDTTNGSTENRSFINEIDFIGTSPHTQGIGLLFGGSSRAQPGLTGFGMSAINLGRLDGYPGTGNKAKWNAFFGTTPGSTRIFAGVNQIEPTGSFTATFASTLMTVTAVSDGIVGADPFSGAIINASGVAAATRIVSQTFPLLVGEVTGGIGRYTISAAHTLSSRAVITGSDSQAIMFSAYGPDGLAITSIFQFLTEGQMVINSPTSVQLWADNNPVGSFGAAAAIIGSTLTAPVHFNVAQLTKPALSFCGTLPEIDGTDTAGTVTMGAVATGCVIAFNRIYTATPSCTVTWLATPLASQSYTVSTTAITLTQTATSGNQVSYICLGIGDA